MSVDEKKLQDILTRLAKLEAAIFSSKRNTLKEKHAETPEQYEGPTGGVRLLIKEGFFSTKRSIDEVYDALASKDYQYIKDVVRNSLNRLASSTGPLVALKTNDGKLYVKRK